MALQTVADMRELSRTLGDDVGFKRTGTLHVATSSDQLEKLRSHTDMLVEENFSLVDWVEPQQAEVLVPWLSIRESALGCALVQEDGFVDPVVLAGAYWQAARRQGATHVAENARCLLTSPCSPSTV